MVAERSEVDLAPARPEAGPRRRPKDRKVQIIRAAARAFSERGYYPVGVDEIAAEVGISGPALYRHFTNKYALLVACAEEGARHLLAVTRAADDPTAAPQARLDMLIRTIGEHTIEFRREVGLYRWERRYLEAGDRARIRTIYDDLNATLAEPISRLHPEAPPEDVDMYAAAILSVLAGISAHRTALPASKLLPLLHGMCWSLLRAPLPPAPAEPDADAAPRGLPITSKREQLLTESIRIFGRQGYHEASIEEIGAAVGINASSVYRYFASKSDLLAAAFHRTGDRFALAIAESLAEAVDRADAASRIADRYARLSFAMPEIMPVYFAEFSNLPQAEQHRLRAIQRQNVLEWANLVEGDPTEARFRVHAAIGQVIDVGRLTRFDARPEQIARVHRLMTALLLDR
ncbi:TetR/AcrR family transcriptional regulator [Nocardia panacis]|uniref:TetR/AcrR family transcriptional regulator n=1 Tax=Nocardia panacis TaxID=2340916 RepID=A0A3A4KR68_9NOCA|nr:TetR/AcrR family transcriptional regulator [Nocardia panacis]RJO72367.1 TetR/AcrR family transcriptional regulator [Nocardia panacis]